MDGGAVVDSRMTGGPAWPDPTVDGAVRAHAAARQDDIALIGPSTTLTWRQLDLAAGRAAAIIAATHETGARVAWLGHNDVGYPITLLGAWRRRGALVGLNWRLPDQDLAVVCRAVGCTHVFSSAEFADRAEAIAGPGMRVVVVDQSTPEPWAGDEIAARLEPAADDLALIFFTSGSTGRPKAVPLQRLGVEIGATTPTAHRFDLRSRLLIVPPVFHLAGAYWAEYGLLYGIAQVYLADSAPTAIVDALREYRITHAVFVPTLIRSLIDELRANPRALPHFRHLAYGSASITAALLRAAVEVFDCEFCQIFGTTEAGGVVSFLEPADHQLTGAHTGRLASAGKPATGVRVQVRDPRTGAEVPAGESGELWLRTPSMSHGYLGLPTQSAAVFVDGWLNSRDIGHLDEDGYLYIEGRSDDMIITGGENVHPDEVEGVLAELPNVAEAAVFGLPDELWGHTVCAAVVAYDSELTADEIIGYCRERMAGYKVPRAVFFLADLPKTATGKVVRAQLPEFLAIALGDDTGL
ncbi:class I adenylate-forming enzyme family protein [Nocardia sp. 004]|uniref:class I adenylate-forming enzyme family protein n=1 Tax=Nocardia sp. 004 TaxID=3385978 RepID=UPI0039A2D813